LSRVDVFYQLHDWSRLRKTRAIGSKSANGRHHNKLNSQVRYVHRFCWINDFLFFGVDSGFTPLVLPNPGRS
jgi:hypothetical protein